MPWPLFLAFAQKQESACRITFLLIQVSLVFGGVVLLSRKYASALWVPQPLGRRPFSAFLLILLPMLLFHLVFCLLELRAIINSATFPQRTEATRMLASIYHQEWATTVSGTSGIEVVCESIMSFVAPVLEEVVFTGFVVNAIAKPYGFVAAALGAPLCFTLYHTLKFGVGVILIPLFFAGVTYSLVRICSGSLLLAVLAHCTVNAVIFLPKWVVAAIWFTRV